jgi:lauroyl/myristoyl acyltransferase
VPEGSTGSHLRKSLGAEAERPGRAWRLAEPIDLYYLLAIGLVFLVGREPLARLRPLLASLLGACAFRVSMPKREAMARALMSAFPERSASERRALARAALSEFWNEMFCWTLMRRERRALAAASLEGVERLEMALRAGNGAILWESNGFGQRIASRSILRQAGWSPVVVHGANALGGFDTPDAARTWARRNLVRPFFEHLERRLVGQIMYLPASESLAFIRALASLLRENQVICISSDGIHGRRRKRPPFLGRSIEFSTGMISLAAQSGAPLLPMFCVRERGGALRLVVEASLATSGSSDRDARVEACLRRYRDLLEAYVRRYPRQYRNWHQIGAAHGPAYDAPPTSASPLTQRWL